MSLRSDIMQAMHKAGLRLDDAATAADVAMRSLRTQRNLAMQQARLAKMSYRQIATIYQVDVAIVHRACKTLTVEPIESTPSGGNVRARQAG